MPGDARHLDPFNRVGERLLRRELHHLVFLPVGAAARDPIDRVFRVLGRRERPEARRPIGRPAVGIDQHLWLPVESLLDVQHALVLQAIVLAEEEILALSRRRRVPLVVAERLDAILELLTKRDPLEVGERHFVFRLDPRGGFRRRVILEPAVGVGHLRAVIGVGVIDFSCRRILQRLGERHHRRRQDRTHHAKPRHAFLLFHRALQTLARARLRTASARQAALCH